MLPICILFPFVLPIVCILFLFDVGVEMVKILQGIKTLGISYTILLKAITTSISILPNPGCVGAPLDDADMPVVTFAYVST